jgi:hypothetical protein
VLVQLHLRKKVRISKRPQKIKYRTLFVGARANMD